MIEKGQEHIVFVGVVEGGDRRDGTKKLIGEFRWKHGCLFIRVDADHADLFEHRKLIHLIERSISNVTLLIDLLDKLGRLGSL